MFDFSRLMRLLLNYSTVQQCVLHRVIIQWLESRDILPALEEGTAHCNISSSPGGRVWTVVCAAISSAFPCTLEIRLSCRLMGKALLTHWTKCCEFTGIFYCLFKSYLQAVVQAAMGEHSLTESLWLSFLFTSHSLNPGDDTGGIHEKKEGGLKPWMLL